MFGNKGMSFTLEAVIAGLMIVTFLLFLFRAPNMEETYDIGMSERGYYCLKSLDDDGLLREDAMDNNYTNIENSLQDCLAGLNYTIQICRDSCIPLYGTYFNNNFTGHDFPDPGSYRTKGVPVADLDGDNDLDIIAANWLNAEPGQINRWYENNGTGNFTGHDIHSDVDRTHGICAADLDGDDDMDVIAGNSNNHINKWYENNGTGNFTSHNITTDSDDTISIYAADLDGDNDPDVMTGNWGQINRWYENNGTGNFTGHDITTDSDSTFAIYAADLDGDDDMDVIAGGNGINRWYENNGTGNFTGHDIHTDSAETRGIHAADLDGDNDLDIITGIRDNVINRWYENDGLGNFTGHDIHSDAMDSWQVYAADLDGDNDMDIIVGNRNQINRWYENNGTGSFTGHDIHTDSYYSFAISAADLDGDNDLDIMTGNWYQENIWYENVEGYYPGKPVPENQTIIVSSYFIAGGVSSDPLKVKLSMWLE